MTVGRESRPLLAHPSRVPVWVVLSATAKGSSHDAATPNQDAHSSHAVPLPGGASAAVVAVADGHGGRRYVRSDVGARLAVATAVEVVEAALVADPLAALEDLLRGAAPRIVERWRHDVGAHVGAHPFSEAEAAKAGSDPGRDPVISYGSTLIVAVALGREVAFAQLGDGDALARVADGEIRTPVPGDDRLVGGETTSLCLPTAADDFRFASLAASADCDMLLVASDGYGNAFASSTWRAAVLTDLGEVLAEGGAALVADQLPSWLAESAEVGGDDVTVVLAVRESGGAADFEVAATVPRDVDEPPRADEDGTPSHDEPTAAHAPGPTDRPRRRRWFEWFSVALVVAGVSAFLSAQGAAARHCSRLGPRAAAHPTPTQHEDGAPR